MRNVHTSLVVFTAYLLTVLLVCYTRSHRLLVVMFLEDKSSAAVATRVHARRVLYNNTRCTLVGRHCSRSCVYG